MAETWRVIAHDTVMAGYADRAALHYGREVAIFSLANKYGSGKKLLINSMKVGIADIIAFAGALVKFGVYRVMGNVNGPLEVLPTPMNEENVRLTTYIRAYYAYNIQPLAIVPGSGISVEVALNWQLLRTVQGIWDEPVNSAYAATTMDEIAGWMSTLQEIFDFTKMKVSDIQRVTIRPGESLVLAVISMPADAAIRADVMVEFEVATA